MADRESKGVAVVTGASAGVGRAVAVELARRGYDVGLLARGATGLAAAGADVEREGRRALAQSVDVADVEQVRSAAAAIEAQLGPIDIWVNDAMTTTFAPVWEVDPGDFQRAIEVTFLGQVWGTLTALDHMRPRDRGAIVNIGSALAFVGIPLQSAYCSAKFACRGFAHSVRAELRREGSGVHLSLVHLPAVNTPQFDWCGSAMDRRARPVAPVYEPRVVAASIVDVALDHRRAKVVGAWNRLVVAAGRWAPGIADHYAARSAWGGQLTDEPEDPDRPDNLFAPVDAQTDHGARGRFGTESGGTLDPAFLQSLPGVGSDLIGAVATRAREAAGEVAPRVRSLARAVVRQRP